MSWALGLGEIHLHSALGEPLSADIDLIAATPRDLSGLHAELAPVDEYQRYGIGHPPYLGTFHFSIATGARGQPILHVTSTDSIPDPFVTFLVEVDWARGRLLREYTVLLDPPVYASGQNAEPPAPVAVPQSAAAPQAAPAPSAPPPTEVATVPATTEPAGSTTSTAGSTPRTVRVAAGDTLSTIARRLGAQGSGSVDQTMLAVFRANPSAFDGNVNLLHRGAILRVPSADRIAALNERDAIAQIDQQMSAWRARGGPSGGHLRLVPPAIAAAGPSGSGTGAGGAAASVRAQNASLRAQVQKLQARLANEQRLVTVQNQALAALQAKLGMPGSSATPPASPPVPAASVAPTVPAPASTPVGASAASVVAATAPAAAKPAKPAAKVPKPATSWLDWISGNWWLPGGLLALLAAGLGFAAFKRRQREQGDELDSFNAPTPREPPPVFGERKPREESFVVEESGEHRVPTIPIAAAAAVNAAPPAPAAAVEAPSPDDTMSTESAVNIDQGDPLAEADFHMAYGLYDQAADLVRIALEREPDRRDLRLKLLEIYFVWGNKDLFLQTAKSLHETRDRAPAGEWDKIVIMGKQICPEDALFAHAEGAGHGSGAPIDLNLEGGENRVDVDLFGEPSGEYSPHEPPVAKDADETAATGESPQLHGDSGLDFVLDAPERGVDESPTREMPQRDEPTVESEVMAFAEPNVAESPTTESPALAPAATDDLLAAKLKAANTEQTAEVSIDDLGLDLEGLEQTGTPDSGSAAHLEPTDHPADAATMVAGLDERSRRMIADAENRTQDRDLTELERELEASFIADLDSSHTEIKTAVLPADAVPTMQIPQALRDGEDAGATSRVPSLKEPESGESALRHDPDATSRLKSVGDGLDLDLDRLAGALGGDTVEQPRAAEEVFSSEVFEKSQSVHSAIDLDVGAPLHEEPGNGATTLRPDEATMPPMDGEAPTEFEPVTMSEVGTKLDLARAYMDMGDPEGARSILDEVVQEGSASQKQEAERLLQSLPG
jgi:pilus assembly protein FimV